jgi:hypothetical protein
LPGFHGPKAEPSWSIVLIWKELLRSHVP